MPGVLGRVTEQHALYYHRYWGFDLFFETKVAAEIAAFLRCSDPVVNGFWVALMDNRIVGAIAIDGQEADTRGARLRWLIVAQEYQGRGLGKLLIREAVEFCKRARFSQIYLTTFA